MYRREQAFVGSTEIRSLDDSYRNTYIGHRDRQQRMVDEIVFAGVDAGDFATQFPKDAARAVATMCVGVSTWFKLDGELSADELRAWLKEQLSAYKVPHLIRFDDALPKGATGKILKRAIEWTTDEGATP